MTFRHFSDLIRVSYKNKPIFSSLVILNRISSTLRELFSSRLPVGSSASIKDGLFTNALAIATLCLSPPDSSCGWCLTLCERPTISRSFQPSFAFFYQNRLLEMVSLHFQLR